MTFSNIVYFLVLLLLTPLPKDSCCPVNPFASSIPLLAFKLHVYYHPISLPLTCSLLMNPFQVSHSIPTVTPT